MPPQPTTAPAPAKAAAPSPTASTPTFDPAQPDQTFPYTISLLQPNGERVEKLERRRIPTPVDVAHRVVATAMGWYDDRRIPPGELFTYLQREGTTFARWVRLATADDELAAKIARLKQEG